MTALIVIVATLYLGGRLVGLFSGTACDASDAQFLTELRSALDTHSTYGSRGDISVQAPCDARQLCVIDSVLIGSPDAPSFETADSVIKNSVRNGVKTNIFLLREQGAVGMGYDSRILAGNNTIVCTPVTAGSFALRTEGRGRFILVQGSP